MKIVVEYLSNDDSITSRTVKAKLKELGLNPLSVRKRKIKHMHNHWWVVLPKVIVGTMAGVSVQKAEKYPDIYGINNIVIRDHTLKLDPNTTYYLNSHHNDGYGSRWDKYLTPIL